LPSGLSASVGIVADLWRFPVKSFGGERLRRAFLGPFGLLGDRRYAVVDAATGEPLTARRLSCLLGFRARSLEPERGEAIAVETPDGRLLPAEDPDLARALAAAVGRAVGLARHPAGFHDAAPLHLVAQSSLAALGDRLGEELDPRRFRANLIVENEDGRPFPEPDWLGRRLAVGPSAVVEPLVPTERCAVTTWEPDTLERDTRVLATIARERDNLVGIYARVLAPGWIAVGDAIHVLDRSAAPVGDR
jgi:hypothetical protein